VANLVGGGAGGQRSADVGAHGALGETADGDGEFDEALGMAIERAGAFGCGAQAVRVSATCG
jgi:hypothetical protein